MIAPAAVVPTSVKAAVPCLMKLPTPVIEPWKLARELFCSSVMSPRPSSTLAESLPDRLRTSWLVSPKESLVSRAEPESSVTEEALMKVLFRPPVKERSTPSLTTMLPKKASWPLMTLTSPGSRPG